MTPCLRCDGRYPYHLEESFCPQCLRQLAWFAIEDGMEWIGSLQTVSSARFIQSQPRPHIVTVEYADHRCVHADPIMLERYRLPRHYRVVDRSPVTLEFFRELYALEWKFQQSLEAMAEPIYPPLF